MEGVVDRVVVCLYWYLLLYMFISMFSIVVLICLVDWFCCSNDWSTRLMVAGISNVYLIASFYYYDVCYPDYYSNSLLLSLQSIWSSLIPIICHQIYIQHPKPTASTIHSSTLYQFITVCYLSIINFEYHYYPSNYHHSHLIAYFKIKRNSKIISLLSVIVMVLDQPKI